VAEVRRLQLGVRARVGARLFAPFDLSVPFWPFFLVVDLVLQPMLLRGIKRRVERAAQERAESTPQEPAPR